MDANDVTLRPAGAADLDRLGDFMRQLRESTTPMPGVRTTPRFGPAMRATGGSTPPLGRDAHGSSATDS